MKASNEKKPFPTMDDLFTDIAKLPEIQRMRIGDAVVQLLLDRQEVTLSTIMQELEQAAAGKRSPTGDPAAEKALELIRASQP
ncbi:MAG: hypothetical protein KJ755_16615 [Alphaproteobacteria bacterium]|nr:hypothetical protein [Alphaproteobacteria bacterium]